MNCTVVSRSNKLKNGTTRNKSDDVQWEFEVSPEGQNAQILYYLFQKESGIMKVISMDQNEIIWLVVMHIDSNFKRETTMVYFQLVCALIYFVT